MKLFGPDLYTNILGWIVLVTLGLTLGALGAAVWADYMAHLALHR